jgi:hypothetical protein
MDFSSASPLIWLQLHWAIWGMVAFGGIAFLFWLYKFASEKLFLTIIIASIVLGLIGGILTTPVASEGWGMMMEATFVHEQAQ